MKNKVDARRRRGLKTKAILKRQSDRARLVVFRSAAHVYAQIVESTIKGDIVLVSASSVEKDMKSQLKGTKVERAEYIGKILGERAKEKNILEVAFDRNGFKYHGRVKALATGARAAGINF
jgi:large subunit ribosomal protein L18